LLQEALKLKDSTDWRLTADKLKTLQQQWKEAGSAGPRDENKLWNKFREACDGFFQARKEAYAKLDEEQATNAKEKEALLVEIEGFLLSGERGKDLDALKAFSNRWLNSGRVSPKLYDAFGDRYRKALDKHYELLKMEGDERRRMQFQGHLDDLKSAPDGKDRIEREGRFIKRKIEELETEMRQMERNMGMFNFKSASGEAMRKEMDKKVEKLAREVERLKTQHKELQKELRSA
jgi:chromosome segregation ATPase